MFKTNPGHLSQAGVPGAIRIQASSEFFFFHLLNEEWKITTLSHQYLACNSVPIFKRVPGESSAFMVNEMEARDTTCLPQWGIANRAPETGFRVRLSVGQHPGACPALGRVVPVRGSGPEW